MLPERCHQVFTLHFSEGMDTADTCCLLLSLGAVWAQDTGSLKVSVTQKCVFLRCWRVLRVAGHPTCVAGP